MGAVGKILVHKRNFHQRKYNNMWYMLTPYPMTTARVPCCMLRHAPMNSWMFS